MRRDTAFAQLESGIGGGVGFYATQYQSVYAMAQCEGDLSSGDCAECINQAVQKSEVECGGASSGQVYLDKCYISYNYYPNGVPRGGIVSAGGSSGGGGRCSWFFPMFDLLIVYSCWFNLFDPRNLLVIICQSNRIWLVW